MKTETISITFTFTVENLDERVSTQDWQEAVYKAFDVRDGRQAFVTEAAGDFAEKLAHHLASYAAYTMGHRRAQRYPGAATRSWIFADTIARPKIRWGSYVRARVQVGETVYDSDD